ncbi:TIGR00730 family Rossman fold protein [Salimicrobium jeotgali]|uniref:LOG family protein n=1 Tax=Salimicrobium jeotgali TaxID=1230341 RepID=UPI000C84F78F|nr:TIGR00730 family Rossman fold protein [Salimicrobium jeotgali]
MKICIFAGSRKGENPEYEEKAGELGRLLAGQGIAVVYGGSSAGLMGALANGALSEGGEVIGVMPRQLDGIEVSHTKLTQLIQVDTMHERKAKMAELADGYIALPGGFGTLEELTETITWAQIGIHDKPVGLLNVAGYYTPFMTMVEHAVESGFVDLAQANRLKLEEEPDDLVNALGEVKK